FLMARPRLRGLPGIAPVEIHPHITARRRRSAEADFVPGDRMGVVGSNDVVEQALVEEQPWRQVAPLGGTDFAVLNGGEDGVLLGGRKLVKTPAVPLVGFGIDGGETTSPGV